MGDETGPGSVRDGDGVGGRADAGGAGMQAAEFDAEFERIGRLVQAAPVIRIRLTQVQPDASQPRTSMDEARLQSLTESIRRCGLLNPIHVYSIGVDAESGEQVYRVACGHRRLEALLRLGLLDAQCKVLPPEVMSGSRAALLALFLRQHDENAEAEGLSRWDESRSTRRMLGEVGACRPEFTRKEQIAWLSGKKHVESSSIYDRLSILESPPALQNILQLPPSHPAALTLRGALSALREARTSRAVALLSAKLQLAAKLLKAVAKASAKTIPELATADEISAIRATPEFDRALRDHCAENGERLDVANRSLDGLVAALGTWDRALASGMQAHLAKALGDRKGPVKSADGQSPKKAPGAKGRKASAEREDESKVASSEDTNPSADGTDGELRPAPGARKARPPRLFSRDARRRRFVVEEARLRRAGAATREHLLELGAALEELSRLVQEAVRALDDQADDTDGVA